jgi:hypothetical protein
MDEILVFFLLAIFVRTTKNLILEIIVIQSGQNTPTEICEACKGYGYVGSIHVFCHNCIFGKVEKAA